MFGVLELAYYCTVQKPCLHYFFKYKINTLIINVLDVYFMMSAYWVCKTFYISNITFPKKLNVPEKKCVSEGGNIVFSDKTNHNECCQGLPAKTLR